MASLLSPRRTRPQITLSAAEAHDDDARADAGTPPPAALTWVLVAAGGALVSALAGWVLVAGFAVVAWLSAAPGTLGGALQVGTELWLLSNGAGARLGSTTITLMPWGVTLLIAFMISRVAGFAARVAGERSRSVVLGVSVVTVAAYLAVLVSVALLFGHPVEAVRGALVMAATIGVASIWGSSRGAGVRLTATWPARAQQIPRAVLAAQLVLLALGTALLLAAAILHLERMESLLVALDPGTAGNIALLALQLAFIPNLIVWATSYGLGAGFGLGGVSVVAPAGTTVGLLPGIPIFGALPGGGPADPSQLWWLAGGVLAGGVAAAVIVLARPSARFDETSLVGGLAGAVSGALFVAIAWLSGGDLGGVRLADLGPRLLPLLILGVSTLGLSGLAAGLVLGLFRGLVLPRLRRIERPRWLRRKKDPSTHSG